MKKMIYAALFIAAPFLCFSQEKAKEPIVIKDNRGIITSVEFPDEVSSNKIPSSSGVFLTTF